MDSKIVLKWKDKFYKTVFYCLTLMHRIGYRCISYSCVKIYLCARSFQVLVTVPFSYWTVVEWLKYSSFSRVYSSEGFPILSYSLLLLYTNSFLFTVMIDFDCKHYWIRNKNLGPLWSTSLVMSVKGLPKHCVWVVSFHSL